MQTEGKPAPDAWADARILLLEDSDIDAQLLLAYLRRGGLQCKVERCVRRSEFEAAMQREAADLVIADYSLPDFDGLAALRVARSHWAGVPFLFVSGVLGEDVATQAVREGATDYVLKRNLGSLAAVVQRALAEARERSKRQRAEMLFRMAAEAADIGIWELDISSQKIWFDQGMHALVGLGHGAMPDFAGTVEMLVDERDRADVHAALAPAMSPHGNGNFEYTHRAHHQRDGRLLWLAVKGRRISGPDGRVSLVGTARDVTQERRRDEALKHANVALEERVAERTRERDRIWNLSVDLMFVCRPDGTLMAVNPAWSRLLGWPAEQLLQASFFDQVHADDRAQAQRALQRLVQSPTDGRTDGQNGPDGQDGKDGPGVTDRTSRTDGKAAAPFDSRLRGSDGQLRWLRWSASADGGLVFAVGRDITDERAAAQALADTNRELKAQIMERSRVEATLQQMQRLEAVGQLTSGVAHDFNNLLAVVMSNINLVRLLLERQTGRPAMGADPRVLERLSSMQGAAERGAKLIAQLLAFSRRQRLEPTVLNLNDVLGGMRDLLQTTMGGMVRIDWALHHPLWHALVDPTQFELIVLNLAINARDAMERDHDDGVGGGGTLTITTGNATLRQPPARPEEPDPGDYVQLTVADNGSGIAPDVVAKIFEPFFTTKDVGKGSGLGLAQVYGVAKQSGGGVRIATQLGQGTAVHVYLPRARQAAAAVDATAPTTPAAFGLDLGTASPEDAASYKLLLVDDDDDVRDVTAQLLGEMGYRVVQAASGPEALQLMDQHADIDLVLADFAMPGMNGAELRRKLRARQPSMRVVIVTGYADLGALHDVEEDLVLQKPVPESVLEERLRKWLPPRT